MRRLFIFARGHFEANPGLRRRSRAALPTGKIIFFGSHARGRPTVDSDVDLLVIMPHTKRAPYQAAAIRTEVRAPFALDLLVRSPRQFRLRVDAGDCFMREIAEHGRVLHES